MSRHRGRSRFQRDYERWFLGLRAGFAVVAFAYLVILYSQQQAVEWVSLLPGSAP